MESMDSEPSNTSQSQSFHFLPPGITQQTPNPDLMPQTPSTGVISQMQSPDVMPEMQNPDSMQQTSSSDVMPQMQSRGIVPPSPTNPVISLTFMNSELEKNITRTFSGACLETDFAHVECTSRIIDQQLALMKAAGNNLEHILTQSADTFGQSVYLITLPLPPFIAVDPGFLFNQQNNSVTFVATNLVRYIYGLLADLRSGGETRSLHITGTEGMGKTAALYVSACALRMRCDENIRITYIPDCNLWQNSDGFTYFLNALVETFYAEELPSFPYHKEIRSAAAWAGIVHQALHSPAVVTHESKQIAMDLLNKFVAAICDTVRQRGLFWIVVFDRYNALVRSADSPRIFKAPFEVIETLRRFFSINPQIGAVVVCSSRNNESAVLTAAHYREVNPENEVLLQQLRLNEEQVAALLACLQKDKEVQYPIDLAAARQICVCTEGIPAELQLFFTLKDASTFGKDVDCDTRVFSKLRTKQIQFALERFAAAHATVFRNILAKIIMKTPLTAAELFRFDKRFVNYKPVDVGGQRMYVVSPVSKKVRNVLAQMHSELCTNVGMNVAASSLSLASLCSTARNLFSGV